MQKNLCSHPGCNQATETIALLVSAGGEVLEKAFCKKHTRLLGLAFDAPDPRRIRPSAAVDAYLECKLRAVLFHKESGLNFVLLRAPLPRSIFVFPTGFIEASSIANLAKGLRYPRPQTHALLVSAVGALGGSVTEAVVSGYDNDNNVFECCMFLRIAKSDISIPCRVSDAVGISLTSGAPIRVNSAFLTEEREVK